MKHHEILQIQWDYPLKIKTVLKEMIQEISLKPL